MQYKVKLWILIMMTMLMPFGCFSGKTINFMTKAYKNQSLKGKHVGAYVPTCEYQILDGFNTPTGKSFSALFSSIKVQLNSKDATICI